MLHTLSILLHIRKHPLTPKSSNYTASPHGKTAQTPQKQRKNNLYNRTTKNEKTTAENSGSNDVHWKKLRTLRT